MEHFLPGYGLYTHVPVILIVIKPSLMTFASSVTSQVKLPSSFKRRAFPVTTLVVWFVTKQSLEQLELHWYWNGGIPPIATQESWKSIATFCVGLAPKETFSSAKQKN